MKPLLVGAFIALAALASVSLATRIPAVVVWLDIGSPGDEGFTSLFFPPESNADETFRWTAEHAELTIPTGRPGTYRLDIRLATVEPSGRMLMLTCGDSQYPVDLTSLGPDSTAVVQCDTDHGEIGLTFDVPVVYLANGGRPLGVSVRDIKVTALDQDDRRAFKFISAVSIFSSIAAACLASMSMLRRSTIAAVVPAAGLLLAWAMLIERYPDGALSAVSGPGGLLALVAGLTAVLLRDGRKWPAAALALVAIGVGLIWQQPDGNLVLESRWIMEELAALIIMPWLAILAPVAAVLLGGQRGYWLAASGTLLALLALVLPALAARNVESRIVEIDAPGWTERGGVAGAIYVVCVFALIGLAIIVAGRSPLRPEVALTAIAAIGITGLLLWRIQIMRFNGDEPHYYTTARSLAVDHDLELLNNYVSERYQTVTYSPVGNIAVERDDSVFRYAASASASADDWLMIPNLPAGWEVPEANVRDHLGEFLS